KEKYKGQICLIYKGTLLYKPEECSHCLCVVPSRIIRWGTTTVRLLLNDVSEYRTYLELKKQRKRPIEQYLTNKCTSRYT
ncbi:hypothetical protein EFM1CSP_20880, partial [Enterococcus faecium]